MNKKNTKYDLRKTKTTDAETLKHCLTVIHHHFQNSDVLYSNYYEKAMRAWSRAETYLKRYIDELFDQYIYGK